MEQRTEKVCTKCGKILQEDENFCSNCGTPAPQSQSAQSSQNQNAQPPEQKKSGFKMLLIILVVILGGAMLCCLFGDSEDTEPTEQVQVETEEPVESSALDLYQTLRENSNISFYITKKATTFLKDHDGLFPVQSQEEIPADLVDTSITYKHIIKNDSKYGDKLMVLSNVEVSQIFEQSMGDGKYITQLNLTDENFDRYWVFYDGTLDNVFEDDYVDVVGLPLSSGSYENVMKGSTEVIVLAGAYVVPGNTLGSFTAPTPAATADAQPAVQQSGYLSLSEAETKNINLFLSNFSETDFMYFDRNDYTREDLILFAVRHNVLNTSKVVGFSEKEDGIKAEDLHKTVQKFFGISLDYPTLENAPETAYGIYYDNNQSMYYWDFTWTDNLQIDRVTNLETVQMNDNGEYVIDATIYYVPPELVGDGAYVNVWYRGGYNAEPVAKVSARIVPNGNFYVLRHYEITEWY